MSEIGPSYLVPVTRVRRRKDAGRTLLIAATATNGVIMMSVVSLIILSTDLSKRYAGLRVLSTVSVIFQILSAAILLWLSWRERRRRMGLGGVFSDTYTQRIRDVAGAATIITVAQALTLGTFIWCCMMIDDPSFDMMEGSIMMTVSVILIVAWTLSIISEGVTLSLSVPKSLGRREHTRPQMAINTQTGGQLSRPILSSPTLLNSPHSVTSNGDPFVSPDTSPEQTSKTSSIISLPAMISKLPQRISSLRRSISHSSTGAPSASPRPSGESAFDTWDTSGVPPEMRSAMTAQPPLAGHARAEPRLPTIPGSRPTSPAKPLDGPFPLPDGKITPNGSLRIDSPPPILVADTADLPPSPTVLNPFIPPAVVSSTSTLHSPISSISPAALSPVSSSTPPIIASIDSSTSLRAPPAVFPTAAAEQIRGSPSIKSFHSTPSYGEATQFKVPPPIRPSLESHPSVESFHHLRQRPANVDESDAQIHPLFRVGSPEPSPMMSPNTVVTGAPVQLSDVPADIVRASVDRVRNTRTPSIGTPSISRPPSRPESSGRNQSRKNSLVGGPGSPAVSSMFAPPQSPALANHMVMTPSVSNSPVTTRTGFTPPQTPAMSQMFMAPASSVSPTTQSGFAPPPMPTPAVSQMFLATPPPTMNPTGALSHMFVASTSASPFRVPSSGGMQMQQVQMQQMQMPASPPTLTSVQMHPGGALSQMFMASTSPNPGMQGMQSMPVTMFAAHSVSPVLANMFPTPQPSAGPTPPGMAVRDGLPSPVTPSPLKQNMMAEPEENEEEIQMGSRIEEEESRRSSRVEDLADMEEEVGTGSGRDRSRAGTPGDEEGV